MPTLSAIGHSFALDGREACIQAIEEARQKILHEADNIVLAFIFASREYNLPAILSGATAQLRTIPLFGFSTEAQISTTGQSQRAIVVALLTGDDIMVEANWWPEFSTDSVTRIQEMADELLHEVNLAHATETPPILLVAADGIHGDHDAFGKTILNPPMMVGALTGGTDRLKSAFQIGGGLGGEHGLSAALLQGNIKAGVGVAHGWQPVGKYFELSRVEDLWIRKLDNQPASELYATLFGQQARDWAFPPLNRLVRLYPLGIETKANGLKVKAPLLVEVDGSLRMTSHLQEGGTGHLMVASAASCLEAAQQAAQQALNHLGSARPILGLVFADIAWKMLFETQPGHELAPIREVVGPNVPLAGGYTLGQLYQREGEIEILNQHLEIVLLGVND